MKDSNHHLKDGLLIRKQILTITYRKFLSTMWRIFMLIFVKRLRKGS